jgi:hypothetical protein
MKSRRCILFVPIPLMAAESVPRDRRHTQRRVAEHRGCGAIPSVHPGESVPRFSGLTLGLIKTNDKGESAS